MLEQLVRCDPQSLEEGGTLRRLWIAHQQTAAAAAPVAEIPEAVTVALPLVKEFESCRLGAYPDPGTGAEPWTIGRGSTTYYDGAPVKQGDRISQELADALLAGRLERDCHLLAQRIPLWQQLSVNQQGALLCFSYNCGPNWFGSSGFSTLTKALRSGQLDAVPAALMLYVNPGGPTEAGLRRRRKAESALWTAAPIRGQSGSDAGTSTGEKHHPNPLVGVPRFQQRDSAQLRALAHFGVTARLVHNDDFQLLEQQIDRGIPVPCGYIHRGPVDRPTGSSHWLIVYGHTPTHAVVNDPWGEPDLIGGTTLNANGMGLRFSRANFRKRWMVEPIGGGAYRHAPGKGWAVVVDSIR